MSRKLITTVTALAASIGAAGAALACSNAYGIPSECRMRLLSCSATVTSAAPVEVSSVRMDGNWTHLACSPAPDGAVNVVHHRDAIEVHHEGRRRRIPCDPNSFGERAEWDGSGRRFTFLAPQPEGERPGRRLGVVDVRAMSDDPPYRVVYTPPPGRHMVGHSWAAGRDALLVLERGEDASELVRVDVPTGERTVLASRPLDFVTSPTHHHRPGPDVRRVIVGGPERGLEVVDVDTGEARPLNLPAIGVHNIDMTSDARVVALLYRRSVRDAAGRTLVGVYLLDIDAALAGRPDALEQVYDGTDVHTLWITDDGKRALWGTPWLLAVWSAGAEPRLEFAGGEEGEIKGAAFDAAGERVAFTVGTSLRVHDLRTGGTSEVARVDGVRGFLAHVWWAADRVNVTLFQDVSPGR